MFCLDVLLADSIASRLDALSGIVLSENKHEIRYYCSCGCCDGGCTSCSGCLGRS